MSASLQLRADMMTPAQKAAVVMLTVGEEAAAEVMRHLSESEVEQLTLEVATLGALPADDLAEILEEFRTQAMAHSYLLSGGEHHAREILRRLRGSDGDLIVDRLLATVQTAPFQFLRAHEPPEIAQHLRDEHAQTIALVLAHLPARFAAQVISGFEPQVQAEIARRVALFEGTVPEVLAQVEASLRDRLGSIQSRRATGRGGVKELATILNQVDRTTERAILGELEATDPELAEKVRELMFVFEDIASLDDRAIQEILRQVDVKQLALALKGVSDMMRQTIIRNLSERARENLLEEIELLGAVPVRDVEVAQTEIVRVVRELEDEGTIVMSRGGEGEFIE